MTAMQQLYDKVTSDASLQAKLSAIFHDASEATKEKLIEFAKDSGFDISIEELEQFLIESSQPKVGELSDEDLDLVAGGKGSLELAISIGGVGVGCLMFSAITEIQYSDCEGQLNGDIS